MVYVVDSSTGVSVSLAEKKIPLLLILGLGAAVVLGISLIEK